MLDYAAQFEARCDGITFTGRRFDHTPGVYVREVEGLLGGGRTQYESVASGVGDGNGEFDVANVRTDPRLIVLSGFVYAGTMFELGHALRRLDGMLGRDAGGFTWDEYGETFSTTVRRGVNSSPRRRGATGFADYTMRFRAPSQAYYGTQQSAGPGTSITLVNRGNDDALPVLSVTGAMPSGYRLVLNGVEYAVSQALAAGQTHRVDMANRILFRNGVAQPGGASSPRQLAIPDNSAATLQLIPNSGTGQVSAQWRDTFN